MTGTTKGEPGGPPWAHQAVGAWATAVEQAWDIAVGWWKLAAEQGATEDDRLGPWSTTVPYPRDPRADVQVRCVEVKAVRGGVVPSDAVSVPEATVGRGEGYADVRVVVRPSAGDQPRLYAVTLEAVEPTTGRRTAREPVTSIRAFGVPGR